MLPLLLWVWQKLFYSVQLCPISIKISALTPWHRCALLQSRKQRGSFCFCINSTLAVNWSSELTGFNWLMLDFHSRPPGAHQLCSWWQPFVPLILSVGWRHSMQDIGTALTELIYTLVGLDLLQAKGKIIMRSWMHMGGGESILFEPAVSQETF